MVDLVKPPRPEVERINLDALFAKITDQTIVIKKAQTEEGNQQTTSAQPNTIYAFNVQTSQLGLSNTLEPDTKNVEVSFDLGLDANNVINLNNGELSISVKLQQTNLTDNNKTQIVKLTGFKKANAEADFPSLLETSNGVVLSINPDNSNANKYIDLDSLNKQDVAVTSVTTTAIGVGVGVSNQQHVSSTSVNTTGANTEQGNSLVEQPNTSNTQENKTETTTGNSDVQNDQSTSDETEEGIETEYTPSPELIEAINKVKNSDISFVKGRDDPTPLVHSQTYAFNLTRDNVRLDVKDKTIPEKVEFTYRVTSLQNIATNLNLGAFTVIVVAVNSGSAENISKEFTFTDFKKADTSLTSLFEEQTSVLNLISEKDTSNPIYLTISDLNDDIKKEVSKESEPKYPRPLGVRNSSLEKLEASEGLNGLNYIFKNRSNFSTDNKQTSIKNVSIQGGIYLYDIKIDEDKKTPIFELGGYGIETLKLVKKDDSNRQKIVGEAAISTIKVANVIPTDISLIPTGVDWDKTRNYIRELTKDDKAQNGFSKLEYNDTQLIRNLYVDLKGEPDSASDLSIFIKPFAVDKSESEAVKFNYQIGFGKDGRSRLLLSTVKNDIELLQKIGFSLVTLTKKLKPTENPIKGETITGIQNLNKLLNKKNVTEPVDSTTFGIEATGFNKQEVKSETLTSEITVKLSDIQSGNTSSNYLIATGISYTGMKQNHKVLASSLTVVVVKKQTEKSS